MGPQFAQNITRVVNEIQTLIPYSIVEKIGAHGPACTRYAPDGSEWMAKVNEAFDQGDEKALRDILNQWESSPESVKGEGVAPDLVRVIRKIALVEQRLKAVEEEIETIEESDLYKVKTKAEEADGEGR